MYQDDRVHILYETEYSIAEEDLQDYILGAEYLKQVGAGFRCFEFRSGPNCTHCLTGWKSRQWTDMIEAIYEKGVRFYTNDPDRTYYALFADEANSRRREFNHYIDEGWRAIMGKPLFAARTSVRQHQNKQLREYAEGEIVPEELRATP